MSSILNVILSAPVKDLVKGITAHHGGQWIEKKKLREIEAQSKTARKFNPKAARTRSF